MKKDTEKSASCQDISKKIKFPTKDLKNLQTIQDYEYCCVLCAIRLINNKYCKRNQKKYQYKTFWKRSFTTQELSLKIAEEVGISYRKAKDYIKFLRLNDYIKFPEKDVCTIINKDFKDVTEEMYLPDYLRYVIKEKGVKWSPIFTRILNYISKKIRYYKYCKEIAEYNLDVWNEEELKKEQILKIVEWLYNNEDWKESDYDKVYEKAVKMAHKHALEAIKWNNCEVSFYESPKRIASRMKCSVDTVRKFIKALKEIFGNTVYMKPDKAVKSMRYNPKLNNYTIALPDREEWKNIFARRFEKIKEGVSRIKDSVYYLKRVWFKKEKGFLWEDKEFNKMAKRDRSITCGDESFPCKKRLSFYHTLKKDLEYWEDNFEKEKEEEKYMEYIHRSEIQREIEENRIDLVAKNCCTASDSEYFDPNTSRTYYEEPEEERKRRGKEIGEIARKVREERKNSPCLAKLIQEKYGDFELLSIQ